MYNFNLQDVLSLDKNKRSQIYQRIIDSTPKEQTCFICSTCMIILVASDTQQAQTKHRNLDHRVISLSFNKGVFLTRFDQCAKTNELIFLDALELIEEAERNSGTRLRGVPWITLRCPWDAYETKEFVSWLTSSGEVSCWMCNRCSAFVSEIPTEMFCVTCNDGTLIEMTIEALSDHLEKFISVNPDLLGAFLKDHPRITRSARLEDQNFVLDILFNRMPLGGR